MAKQIINIGRTANDKSGDPLRTAFTKVNENFTELYSAIGADVQIPVQTGNGGKFLTTNGTTLSWVEVSQGSNTANTGFIIDTIYNSNGMFIENSDLTHGATAALHIPENGETVIPLSLQNNYGPAAIITGTSPSDLKTWTFGKDGKLKLPNLGTISNPSASIPSVGSKYTFNTDYMGATGPNTGTDLYINDTTESQNISIGWVITFADSSTKVVTAVERVASTFVHITWADSHTFSYPITVESADYAEGSTTNNLEISPNGSVTWTFSADGVLTLPVGADIVDSTGTSVLGSITIDGGDSSTTF